MIKKIIRFPFGLIWGLVTILSCAFTLLIEFMSDKPDYEFWKRYTKKQFNWMLFK